MTGPAGCCGVFVSGGDFVIIFKVESISTDEMLLSIHDSTPATLLRPVVRLFCDYRRADFEVSRSHLTMLGGEESLSFA